MIQGIFGGFRTLIWSMVLYFLTVYVVAFVCRETLGPQEPNDIENYEITEAQVYFATVGDSVFTVFRCSFGDCSSAAGTPLLESFKGRFAMFVKLGYMIIFFGITIGLF